MDYAEFSLCDDFLFGVKYYLIGPGHREGEITKAKLAADFLQGIRELY
jgi:hypothetical protein